MGCLLIGLLTQRARVCSVVAAFVKLRADAGTSGSKFPFPGLDTCRQCFGSRGAKHANGCGGRLSTGWQSHGVCSTTIGLWAAELWYGGSLSKSGIVYVHGLPQPRFYGVAVGSEYEGHLT